MFMPEALIAIMLTTPPDTAAKPVETNPHGVRMVDPYSWLREKDNPEVIDYLNAENAYARSVLGASLQLSEHGLELVPRLRSLRGGARPLLRL